ncbi:MAG TPA: nitroreductase family protein [Methanoregulaceae archaeon]|nr:nitroreductase family protein [Methanoregulaceae archaeon]
MDSSEFYRFLSTRTSIRSYRGEELGADPLAYILSCASTAPSAGNLESWDVVVVTDPDRRGLLAEAALDQPHVAQAPAVLVVCANYVRAMSRYGERGILYALCDASIAASYMMLAAHAFGLGSCWTGAFDDDDVRSVLGLPQHVRPVVLLTVGHGEQTSGMTARLPVEEHVHLDTW